MKELTQEAQEQILVLENQIIYLQTKADKLKANKEQYSKSYYKIKLNEIGSRQMVLQNRIWQIEELGLSTHERGELTKAINRGEFIPLGGNKDMYGASVESVGYFKPLQNYLSVKYYKNSTFLRNIEGCKSDAGKTEIEYVEIITERKYNSLLKGQEE